VVWYEILAAGKKFGAVPWRPRLRATRFASKASCRSTGMKSPTRSMCGKPDWIVSARWTSRIFIGRAALETAKAGGLKKKPWLGLRWWTAGIARDGIQGLDEGGREDWLRYQRFASAVLEEEYCVGLCSARAKLRSEPR